MCQYIVVRFCIALSLAISDCLSSIRIVSVDNIPAFVHVIVCKIYIWNRHTLIHGSTQFLQSRKLPCEGCLITVTSPLH